MIKRLTNNFEKIFIIFLYMQPFLDISTGILLHFNYNVTISSIIRFIFMGMSIIYLLFKVKDKKVYIYLTLLFTYFLLFSATILIYKGLPAYGYEIKNMLSTYYFVIILITLLKLYKNNNFNTKHIVLLYFTYLLLVFIPNIFNIGFNSYYESKIGQTGWFLSANTISGILSILLPFVLISIRKIKLQYIILLIINIYVIFSIGTKVPVIAFTIIVIVNLIYYLILLIKEKRYKILSILILPIILLIGISITLLPKTTFYKNIKIHINFLEKIDNNKISKEHLIDHFIFSQRLTFEKKTRKAYTNSNILEKVFGIGYIENYSTDNVSFKIIEIDYMDILYRHGPSGFVLFFYPVIICLIKIFKKIRINYKNMNIYLSILLILLLGLFQGHIFTTPAISLFVALIISCSYNNSITFKNKLK